MDQAERAAREALRCLFIGVPSTVAQDVKTKVLAWVAAEREAWQGKAHRFGIQFYSAPKLIDDAHTFVRVLNAFEEQFGSWRDWGCRGKTGRCPSALELQQEDGDEEGSNQEM